MQSELDGARSRLDQLDALHEALNARVTAVLAEATRRALAGEAALIAASQAEAMARDAALAALDPRFVEHSRRTRAAVGRLVALEISRERDAHRVLAAPGRWIARAHDGRDALADADMARTVAPGEVVQPGRYWRRGDMELIPLSPSEDPILGFDVAAWALVPPDEPLPGPSFSVLDAGGDTLVEGVAVLEADLGPAPLRLRFLPVEGAVTLRLVGAGEIEAVGLKLYERRRLQPVTRRLRSRGWLVRPVHA